MTKRQDFFEKLKPFLGVWLGAAIISFGLFNIHSRSSVTEGGIIGMTLLIRQWLHISPAYTEGILNLACYVMGFKYLGKGFIKYAVASSAGFAFFYLIWEAMGPVLPDLSGSPLLAALLGGVFVGVGCGLVVRSGGASSGDDVLALVINKKTKLSLGRSYFVSDAIVLLLSLSYIPASRIIYSFITVMLSSFLVEKVYECKLRPFQIGERDLA